jgi:hypothetical protein
LHVAWVHLTAASICLCVVLKKRKVEDHDDFILGPVSPKEYKDTMAKLNGSQMNRVFEFFKVTGPSASASLSIARRPRGKLLRLPPLRLTLPRPQRLLAPAAHYRRRLQRGLLPPLRGRLWPKENPGRNGAPGRRTRLRQPRKRASLILIPASWGLSSPSCLCTLLHLREVVVGRLAAHCLCR